MNAAQPILEVHGLTKSFGGLIAVNAVDLSINEGEIVGLIGPNGSGKTTFFHCITGFYKPDSGSIRYHDGDSSHELAGLQPHEVRSLGIARTFQTREIFANMTLMDSLKTALHTKLKTGLLGAILNLRYTRREEAEAHSRAVEVMGMFPNRFTADRWDQSAGNLSFANRCRLEIAMSLVARPRLLLIDEPAAGMNPAERVEIMEIIRDIRDLGYTLLVVEHNMRVVLGISDRLVVFDKGIKIADGIPDEVINDPGVCQAYLGEEYDIA
jgi:branched-chain amino acid transport system ATP-binding protein